MSDALSYEQVDWNAEATESDNSQARITTLESKAIFNQINVKDYGAVGDGVTDDTSAIQSAIDTGYHVFGEIGDTYLITGLTQSTNNQKIDFTGSTLKLAADSSTYMLSCSGDYVKVIGGTYDGNKSAGQTNDGSTYYNHASVRITGDYCIVDSVVSMNSAGLGIKAQGTNYSVVKNCTVSEWGICGIYFESTLADAYGNRILNNYLDWGTTAVGGAINLLGHSAGTYLQYDWVISGNIVKGKDSGHVATDGSIFSRSPNGVISNNVVNGTPFGITTDWTDYVVISNNVVYGNSVLPGYGIEFGGSHAVITGNSISDCVYGIIGTPRDMDYATITNNNISNFTTNAIHVAPTSGENTAQYMTISGNTIVYATGATSDVGISLVNSCEYAHISGNNFIGPGSANTQARGVKLVEVTGHCNVVNNKFSGVYRPFEGYTAGAVALTNLAFSFNDCSVDMPANSALFVITSGSATIGAGCSAIYNRTATGFNRSLIDIANNIMVLYAEWSPEEATVAGVGSMYLRTNGSAGATLYVKESGTGNTGWAAK